MEIQRYTRPAIALHWLIALLIIFNTALAWAWPFLADENVRPAIDGHKSIGILVLGLAIMRLLWRVGHKPPPSPSGFKRWELRLSGITHVLLYAIMFGLPLSGWIMDSAWKDAASHPMMFFNLFEWPRIGSIMALDPASKEAVHEVFEEVHEAMAKVLYVLFVLHVAGALKHQWFDKEAELQRMWPK
jgi:cytochrome b561